MDLKGREEMGGVEGMRKKGQMVPLDAWCLTGSFYRGCCGMGVNKHSQNTIVTIGLWFNGGAPNLTPATLPVFSSSARVLLLPSLAGWLAGIQPPLWLIFSQSVIGSKTKCAINQMKSFCCVEWGFFGTSLGFPETCCPTKKPPPVLLSLFVGLSWKIG